MARPLSGPGWVGRAQRGRSQSRARRHGRARRHRARLHPERPARGGRSGIDGRRAAVGSGRRVRRRRGEQPGGRRLRRAGRRRRNHRARSSVPGRGRCASRRLGLGGDRQPSAGSSRSTRTGSRSRPRSWPPSFRSQSSRSKGADYAVGLGAASSRATRVGFEPAGALLFGTGLTAVSRSRNFGRLCVGGFSRDRRAGCVSWSARPRPPGPRSQSTSEAVFDVIDTTSGELHARATLSAIGRRRFSLGWVKDRPPRDFGFVAFGSELRAPTLGDRLRLLGRGGSLRE